MKHVGLVLIGLVCFGMVAGIAYAIPMNVSVNWLYFDQHKLVKNVMTTLTDGKVTSDIVKLDKVYLKYEFYPKMMVVYIFADEQAWIAEMHKSMTRADYEKIVAMAYHNIATLEGK